MQKQAKELLGPSLGTKQTRYLCSSAGAHASMSTKKERPRCPGPRAPGPPARRARAQPGASSGFWAHSSRSTTHLPSQNPSASGAPLQGQARQPANTRQSTRSSPTTEQTRSTPQEEGPPERSSFAVRKSTSPRARPPAERGGRRGRERPEPRQRHALACSSSHERAGSLRLELERGRQQASIKARLESGGRGRCRPSARASRAPPRTRTPRADVCV